MLAASLAPGAGAAEPDLPTLKNAITKKHDRAVTRLREWIRRPAIAAEKLGIPAGADHLIGLLRVVGSQHAERIATDGNPGVLATLDAGAPKQSAPASGTT